MKEVVVSTPGKLILFGEHAVVYGYPALVVAVNKRLKVKAKKRGDKVVRVFAKDLPFRGVTVLMGKEGGKIEGAGGGVLGALSYVKCAVRKAFEYAGEEIGVDLEITSDLPIGAGMGSSAAVTVATLVSVLELLNAKPGKKEIARMGYEVEKEVQGAASPTDTAITTFGGMLYIKPWSKDVFEKIRFKEGLELVVGYTGVSGPTKEMVAKVRVLKERRKELIETIMEAIGTLVKEAKKAIEKGDLKELGELMNINHGLLDALGVSTSSLSKLVYAAREAGALGAKLTGAGGGGSMYALAPGKVREVLTALRVAGGIPIPVKPSSEGVVVELAR